MYPKMEIESMLKRKRESLGYTKSPKTKLIKIKETDPSLHKIMEPIELKFDEKSEIINIINTGGCIVKILLNQRKKCALIESHVKFVKEIGDGQSGAHVFIVTIPGKGIKKYVVKTFDEKDDTVVSDEKKSVGDYADIYYNRFHVSKEWFIRENGGNPNRIINIGDTFRIPYYAILCKTKRESTYERFDYGGFVTVPKGSYLCTDSKYSEYVIGILCAELYTNGICINFYDTFDFATCTGGDGVKQYIFMELLTGELYGKYQELRNIKVKYKGKEFSVLDILYIQTLLAIAYYQKIYNLQHNDLHFKNLFLSKVDENTKYLNERLTEFSSWQYNINFGGKSINVYTPPVPYLIKIADFGLSVKYGTPIVGNKNMMEHGYTHMNFGENWYPNWYTENYDIMMVTLHFFLADESSLLLRRFMEYIIGNTPTTDNILKVYRKNKRPNISIISQFDHATPEYMIQNKELMDVFLEPHSTATFIGID